MQASAIRLTSAIAAACLLAGADWRHFRGTDNRSVSDETGLPTSVDPQSNVAWKAALPGSGPSSPIVAAGRVLVTAASGPHQDRLHVLCFDAASGRLRWERQLWAMGNTLADSFGGVAASTPASDGQRVVALFSSNDLACFDLDGNLQWYRGLGYEHPAVRNDVGMASSPLVVGPTVIVQLDGSGPSLAAGIDLATGQTRWQIDRGKGPMWTSPTVLRGRTPAEDLVLLQGRDGLSAHDPRTGQLVWSHRARCHSIASVTTDGDRVFLPAEGIDALRYDPAARKVEFLWHENRLHPAAASPIVHEGRVYVMAPPAILACGDAADGKVLWQLRLKGSTWSTPVLADGRLYFASSDGLVQVVELGEKGRVVASFQLDPKILASPAVADGALYFRSDEHLWRIAAAKAK